MRFRRLCNLSVNVFVQLTLLGNEAIEKKGTGFNGSINSRYTPQVCFDYCPPPLIAKFNPGGEDGFSQPYDVGVLVDEDKPLLIDLYFGGARSKGFALFKNTPVAFGFPEVASELVRDIFEFFDLFLFLFIILARNIDCKSILQKTSKQFGLVLQNTSENRHTSAIFSASHFAGEFAYVARYVSPKCVSVWLFTVETLTFSPDI